jgi:hypothetical protein
MSDESVNLWWTKEIPFVDGMRIVQEPEPTTGTMTVTAYAPGEPPPAPLPSAGGTSEEQVGDHLFTIDWDFADGELTIHDIDMVISKDDQIG